MAIDSNGDVLMSESVYFGHLFNPSGSMNHSSTLLDGWKYETIFCNLDNIPRNVQSLYFLITVATYGTTLKDLKKAIVRVKETKTGDPLCQCIPRLAGNRTSMLVMHITRVGKSWSILLIDEMNDTAKEIGSLLIEENAVDSIQNFLHHIQETQSNIERFMHGSLGSMHHVQKGDLDSVADNNEQEIKHTESMKGSNENENDLHVSFGSIDNTDQETQQTESMKGTDENENDPEVGKVPSYDNEMKRFNVQINSMEQNINEMKSLVNISQGLISPINTQGKSVYTLSNDTFTLMMFSKSCSITCFFLSAFSFCRLHLLG